MRSQPERSGTASRDRTAKDAARVLDLDAPDAARAPDDALDGHGGADAQAQSRTEGSAGGSQRVVLALGSSYYHDGRVAEDRYASDLAPTLVGTIAAGRLLLRNLFDEFGAPPETAIHAECDRWQIRFGTREGETLIAVIDEEPADIGEAPSGPGASDADSWVRALTAARDEDHRHALAGFEAEAEQAEAAGAPQRAAIAYRAAAASAQSAGRADHANRLLRLAGKSYLEIAERAETLPQGMFMAFRESARCFLEAGNLPLAQTCLSKAIAIGETLGFTESA
jgi:hypothetical protein